MPKPPRGDDANPWELELLVTSGLDAPEMPTALAFIDATPAIRQSLAAIGLTVIGAIGTELMTRDRWDTRELPRPYDSPEAFRAKTLRLLEAFDACLNAQRLAAAAYVAGVGRRRV
jgi:hypothetical protein